MPSRNILQVFDQYQKAKLEFAQSIAELSTWQSNIKCLERSDVVDLLVGLIDDKNISIRRTVVAAVGRLSERSEQLAVQFSASPLLSSVIQQFNTSDDYFKRTVLHFIRGVSRHNETLAWSVVKAGGLAILISGLEHFDLHIKENSVCALGLIGRHNKELSQIVADNDAISKLVTILEQPDISLKQFVINVLEDLAPFEAEAIVNAGALPHLVTVAQKGETKLKKSALGALEAICAYSEETAKAAVESGVLDAAILSSHPASARLLRNIVKQSLELAQIAVDAGACGTLTQFLNTSEEVDENAPRTFFYPRAKFSTALAPASAALGHIAAQSDQLALVVIASKAVPLLVKILSDAAEKEKEECFGMQENDEAVGACAWALGHIARHSPHHSEAVGAAGAFPILLQLFESRNRSEDTKKRISCALQQAIKCCLHRPALDPLLHTAPLPILEGVLSQYTKILHNDPRARRLFVTTGALQKLQELPAAPGSQLEYIISAINFCFPEDIVRYYSPGHPDYLLEQVENYTPQIPELFLEKAISVCSSKTSNVNKTAKNKHPKSIKK